MHPREFATLRSDTLGFRPKVKRQHRVGSPMVLFLFQRNCFLNMNAFGPHWSNLKVGDGGDIGDTCRPVEANLHCESTYPCR